MLMRMTIGVRMVIRVGMSSMGLLVLISFVGVVAINHMGGNIMMEKPREDLDAYDTCEETCNKDISCRPR